MRVDEAFQAAAEGLSRVKWRPVTAEYGAPEGTYEWYYAENGLYLIRHRRLGTVRFLRARSPLDAWEKLTKIWKEGGI